MEVRTVESKLLQCAQSVAIEIVLNLEIPEGHIGLFSDSLAAVKKNLVTRMSILRACEYNDKNVKVIVQNCTLTPTRIGPKFLLGYIYVVKLAD